MDLEERYLELELDQLSAERRRPIPPAELGPVARAGLWGLRIFCLVLSAMVVYTFVSQLQ